MVSLDQQSIRRGHRELLSTFREFVQPITSPDGAPAPDELRGAVAFLRQGIMTFARREEACPAPGETVSKPERQPAFLKIATGPRHRRRPRVTKVASASSVPSG